MPLTVWRRAFAAFVVALGCAGARAEPYLAVQTGLRCAQCHVNQTGGGMRTRFGNAFAQTQLAANRLPDAGWDGRIARYFGLGANLRASALRSDAEGAHIRDGPDLREARLYLQLEPIAERLSFYLDQFVAPGASTNREAFALYRADDGSHYVKAGRFYLPFGWRLQDVAALVNAATGIDMTGPDRGVEVGWDSGALSLQLAVSNGTFGKADVDSGKQWSVQLAWIGADWRVGAAGNFNDRAAGERGALAVFGGLRTGPVAWLGEIAAVEDHGGRGGTQRSTAWLAEGNWRVAQGHNLKFGVEGLDPDRGRGGDRQTRLSALYEFTPIGVMQLRGGVRRYDGPGRLAPQNRREFFVEVHGFF